MLLGGHQQATLLTVYIYDLLGSADVTRMTRIQSDSCENNKITPLGGWAHLSLHPQPKINELALYASLHMTLTHVQHLSGYEALSGHYQKCRSQLSHAKTIYDVHVLESTNCHTRIRAQLTSRDKTTTGRILRLARDKTCHLQSLNVFWHLTYEL